MVSNAPTSKPRLVIADDNPEFLSFLCKRLAGEFELAAILANGPDLVVAAVSLKPDLIITDLSMPGFSGLDAIRQIREQNVRSQTIVLTAEIDAVLAEAALAIGADAFVVKIDLESDLVNAVRAVSQGLKFVSPRIER
jgi:DNA-binding NarL/FixJ family response regulator